MSRPFQVLGVQQIAIGATDKKALQKLWVDLFGLQITGQFTSERENVDEDICAIGSGPFKVEVDLMQPLDVDKKAGGAHHAFEPHRLVDRQIARGGGMAECSRFAFCTGRYSQRRGWF